MSEISALYCYFCPHVEIVATPDKQEDLLKIVMRLKFCPDCGNPSICQQSAKDEYGNLYSFN